MKALDDLWVRLVHPVAFDNPVSFSIIVDRQDKLTRCMPVYKTRKYFDAEMVRSSGFPSDSVDFRRLTMGPFGI